MGLTYKNLDWSVSGFNTKKKKEYATKRFPFPKLKVKNAAVNYFLIVFHVTLRAKREAVVICRLDNILVNYNGRLIFPFLYNPRFWEENISQNYK